MQLLGPCHFCRCFGGVLNRYTHLPPLPPWQRNFCLHLRSGQFDLADVPLLDEKGPILLWSLGGYQN